VCWLTVACLPACLCGRLRVCVASLPASNAALIEELMLFFAEVSDKQEDNKVRARPLHCMAGSCAVGVKCCRLPRRVAASSLAQHVWWSCGAVLLYPVCCSCPQAIPVQEASSSLAARARADDRQEPCRCAGAEPGHAARQQGGPSPLPLPLPPPLPCAAAAPPLLWAHAGSRVSRGVVCPQRLIAAVCSLLLSPPRDCLSTTACAPLLTAVRATRACVRAAPDVHSDHVR
jgi:hypothetical protein